MYPVFPFSTLVSLSLCLCHSVLFSPVPPPPLTRCCFPPLQSDGAGAGAGAAGGWHVAPSDAAGRTNNPIRKVVDNIKIPKDHAKALIPLSLGEQPVYPPALRTA